MKQPSPPHKSYFLRHNSYISRQLFVHQSTGHSFPITQKTSEPKVHKVCRDSRVVRTIEQSHLSIIFLFSFSLCHSDISRVLTLQIHHQLFQIPPFQLTLRTMILPLHKFPLFIFPCRKHFLSSITHSRLCL